MWILLPACVLPADPGDVAPPSDDSGTPAVSDLVPLEAEAFDYEAVCADSWTEENCSEEPCDMGAHEAAYEEAWRAWVQPRWGLTDAEYAERVDLWRASWDEGDGRLDLAHVVSVGWHRAMIDYSSGAVGTDPSPEAAAAYWASYDPAFDVPFRETLVPYADILATAQTCADEIGRPLLPTGPCTTRRRRIADEDTNFSVIFATEDERSYYGSIEIDLVTGEASPCELLSWGDE